MESIFNSLYAALYGNLWLAIPASFLWGVISVLFSPCHLSGIPLIMAVLTGKQALTARQTFRLSLLFSLGVLVSIALIGGVTALLGRMWGDLGAHANLFFGIALCLGGVLLLDVIPLSGVSFVRNLRIDGAKAGTVFITGLLFGLALGPCSFAFIAPLLTLIFSMAETRLLAAIGLILAYAIGHVGVIAVAGTSVSLVQKVLNWNEGSKGPLIFKRVCAALVIAAGIYLIFK